MHRDAGETQELTDNLRGRLREARTAPEALRALLNSLQDAGVRGAGLAGWTAGHWTAGQWNAGPGTAAAPDLRDGTWTVTPLAFTDPPAALYLPAPAAGTPAAHLEALLTLTGQALRRIAREDSSAPPDQPTTQPPDLHTTARRADLAEARLQQLIENGPVAVAAGTTDGQLLLVNDAYLNLLGFTRSEFSGGQVNWAALTPPEYRASDREHYLSALTSRQSVTYEKDMLDRGGQRVPVQVTLLPAREEDRDFSVAYVRDLRPDRATAAGHAEQLRERTLELQRLNTELAARTAALEQFAELSRDLVFEHEPVALIGRAQEIAISLMPDSVSTYYEPRGRQWTLLSHRGHFRNPVLLDSLRGGLPRGATLNVDRPYDTGAPYYQEHFNPASVQSVQADIHVIRSSASFPVRSGARTRGVLVIGRHETHPWTAPERTLLETVMFSLRLALERAEQAGALQRRTQELERSNAELEQFAFIASHDLQEPLRSVTSFSQLLIRRFDRTGTDARAAEYLRHITAGTHRMQQLIQDLLSFARVTSEQAPLTAQDTAAALQAVLTDLSGPLRDAHATVTNGTLPPVLANGTQLRQLLQNLIGNAVKFRHADRPPIISVTAQREGDLVHVQVTDNGIGVPAEYHERIFTVFQRLHVREAYAGNGIGLSIARRVAERHGGNLWITSTPGQGSTFHFTLPAPSETESG
ncbi:ATP-binding protein (plasmid) [Deinococcus aquaticus]|uniref:histidine kinase n=1 Tax=Deinococcus aquaticus TaxID=328692 RepID=A0ABY7V834_9DEIO|nr:ATP-binding protein [Deinococcus aquaticus]WDA60322.1 ATP-binding protein [Deinococcus aquaticus]